MLSYIVKLTSDKLHAGHAATWRFAYRRRATPPYFATYCHGQSCASEAPASTLHTLQMAALRTIQNLSSVLRVHDPSKGTYLYKQRTAPSQASECEYVGPSFVKLRWLVRGGTHRTLPRPSAFLLCCWKPYDGNCARSLTACTLSGVHADIFEEEPAQTVHSKFLVNHRRPGPDIC